MKKIGLLFCFLFFASFAFGQQFLWSTIKSDSVDVKYVPINMVTKEVLTFYDQYEYYFDLTGYSKKRFIEEIDYGFEDWDWLYEIKDLTVFALRSNTGSGSVVLVMCISKDNINLIMFSNDILLDKNAQSTGSYNKNRFISWFKTLLN